MQLTRKTGWLQANESRHWWLRQADGTVVDLTVGPADVSEDDYPYEQGGPKGFMQHGYRRPNRTRCAPLIEQVKRGRAAAAA